MLLKLVVLFVVFAKLLVINECQQLENRIIGGEFCKIEEVPYIVHLMVAFFNKTSNKIEFGPLCGGSIITPSWILTAAHCRQGEGVILAAVIGSDHNQLNSTRVHIDKFIVYPDYDSNTNRHDIALLHLNKSIDEPMTYPVFVKTKLETDKCTEGFIAGWGKVGRANTSLVSPFLKCANITLAPKKKCTFTKNTLDSAVLDGTKVYQLITADETIPFYGDSGGPLTCDGKLIGLDSFGDAEFTTKGHCEVYTKIESYFKFIANYTGLKLPAWEPTDPEYAEDSSDAKTENATQKHEEKSTSSCSNSFSTPMKMIIFFLLTLIQFWGLF